MSTPTNRWDIYGPPTKTTVTVDNEAIYKAMLSGPVYIFLTPAQTRPINMWMNRYKDLSVKCRDMGTGVFKLELGGPVKKRV